MCSINDYKNYRNLKLTYCFIYVVATKKNKTHFMVTPTSNTNWMKGEKSEIIKNWCQKRILCYIIPQGSQLKEQWSFEFQTFLDLSGCLLLIFQEIWESVAINSIRTGFNFFSSEATCIATCKTGSDLFIRILVLLQWVSWLNDHGKIIKSYILCNRA